MRQPTPQETMDFVIRQIEAKSGALQPNMKNNLVQDWQKFVNSLDEEEDSEVEPTIANEKNNSNSGFLTGDE